MSDAQPIAKTVCPPQPGAGDPLKVGFFAGVHGDEEAGTLACLELIEWTKKLPPELAGYELHFYPVCNPTGADRRTRECCRGFDLNREFWKGSSLPEVRYLESELRRERYDGIISLHADDTSEGVYGFVSGALLSEHILEPALAAAATVLPRNLQAVIDGFPASRGIIREGYTGVLSAPPEQRPRALEIVFETPALAPLDAQVRATVLAVRTMLREYRELLAYAANL
ncbi:MAG: succinylglutamate desuccinylase/aspartoacylase family protein [Verrucomicrobiales bacterium]|nr:succinylglutamate desuccinylase/aspartoacylase family protein [Verrucomicrobiales bacterium]